MKPTKAVYLAALFLGAAMTGMPAAAQNVKITALGSHDGELCPRDVPHAGLNDRDVDAEQFTQRGSQRGVQAHRPIIRATLATCRITP